MNKLALPLAISAILSVMAGGAAADDNVNAWRLFVADHDKPTVKVIDALDGDTLDTFTLKGPASLSRSESGATVFAVQGSANTVSAIASGIAFHDHGDHADIDVDPPKLLSVTFDGKKPGHFVERQGKVAQWFDGESHALFFSEQSVLEGKKRRRASALSRPTTALPFHTMVMASSLSPTLKMPQSAPSARGLWISRVTKWGMTSPARGCMALPVPAILTPWRAAPVCC